MRLPQHIGIIPDGNRRWAQGHGLKKQDGYQHGLEPGLATFHLAQSYGIPELTFYGFTTDNCKRPAAQRQAFAQACLEAVELIAQESASILVLGDSQSPCFPAELKKYTTRTDVHGGGTKVNFLINYGWQWDLAPLSGQNSNRKKIRAELRSHDISNIDLIVRWGGMRRLSGFLPVQSVYADFYVVEDLWPNFQPQQFRDALQWYDKQDVTLGG